MFGNLLKSITGMFQPKPQPAPVKQPVQGLNFSTPAPKNTSLSSFGSGGPALNLNQALNSGGLTMNRPAAASSGVAPSTGGQAPGGGGGGGQAPGGSIDMTPPSSYQPNPNDYVNLLKNQYAQNATDLQAQNPLLDQSYNAAKGDIQSGIDQTTATANSQKGDINQQFGDLLKNTLQTYRDTNKQRQGTFSALGTLDSSAFGDQQARADEDLVNQQAAQGVEKSKELNNVDSTLTAYVKQGQDQLSQLAVQYQQGKNGIASALANNNLQEASAIQSALDQVRSQAANIQNSITNFANQASYLKSLGYGVNTNIKGISATPFYNQVMGTLGQVQNSANGQYQIPNNQQVQGQGYILSNGKKINPLTGLPAQ